MISAAVICDKYESESNQLQMKLFKYKAFNLSAIDSHFSYWQ